MHRDHQYLAIGALLAINNLANSTLHMAKDATNLESWATSHVLARAGQVIRESINSPTTLKANQVKRPLQWMARRQYGNCLLAFTWYMGGKTKVA